MDACLDKGRGIIADVLVQWGELSVGDAVVIGTSFGRVKSMEDHLVRVEIEHILDPAHCRFSVAYLFVCSFFILFTSLFFLFLTSTFPFSLVNPFLLGFFSPHPYFLLFAFSLAAILSSFIFLLPPFTILSPSPSFLLISLHFSLSLHLPSFLGQQYPKCRPFDPCATARSPLLAHGRTRALECSK